LPKNTHIVVHMLPSTAMPPDTEVAFFTSDEPEADAVRTDFYCSEASARAARQAVVDVIALMRRIELSL
jgi:hypothetical protein